eukprot:2691090-Lingulodinium_polyedra.AAC.1
MGAGACCKVMLTFALGLIQKCGIGLDGVVIAPMTWGGGDRGGCGDTNPRGFMFNGYGGGCAL